MTRGSRGLRFFEVEPYASRLRDALEATIPAAISG
jgi:hypothetical protein